MDRVSLYILCINTYAASYSDTTQSFNRPIMRQLPQDIIIKSYMQAANSPALLSGRYM